MMKYGLFNINDGQHDLPMLDWLDEILKTEEASKTIIMSHVPLLSSERMKKLLKSSRASLYIAGHWHVARKTKLEDTEVLVVGGGGAPLDGDLEASIERGLGVFSYAVVKVGKQIESFFMVPFSIEVSTRKNGDTMEIFVTNRSSKPLTLRGIKVKIPWKNFEISGTRLLFKALFIPFPSPIKVKRLDDKIVSFELASPADSVLVIKVRKK